MSLSLAWEGGMGEGEAACVCSVLLVKLAGVGLIHLASWRAMAPKHIAHTVICS